MPPKIKKYSKAQSRLVTSDHSASSQTPPLTPPLDFESTQEDLLCSLEEASSKYPTLIGKSAIIGKVVNVVHETKGCKIWLSESSMVASSLTPGSIVSVI